GDGARIALLNRQQRVEALTLVRAISYIETATDPNFQQAFVEAIHIPHASAAFPHLAEMLPQRQNQVRKRRTVTMNSAS
ncbi:MAG: DUF4445 domain-containing protein, partial [Anaerolineae bacterium]|nr:DUF4445 domain-containing protein [Anaerolineae bacterium]